MNKYHAKKCRFGDEVYDSKKEMKRHQELLLLEKVGKISNLRRQVKYILIPVQREYTCETDRKGNYKKGKVLERECTYIADFEYIDNESGEVVVEDTKGYRTEVYRIKRKMMLYIRGIRIREI